MILICKICGQYICSASCPGFEGRVVGLGMPCATCSVCETGVYNEEEHYTKNGKVLCKECAMELISPELLDFLDCADIDDFF